MQEAEFLALPIWKYAICRCGRRDRLSIKRDIYDYINGRPYHTLLYLCSGCHWRMDCEYRAWERYFKREFGVDTWELDDGYLTTQQFSAYVMEGFKRYKEKKEKKEREEKRKHMDTALIASEHAMSAGQIAAWANGLVGTEVDIARRDTTHHVYIDKILQIQLIPDISGFAKAIVLVQVLEAI